MTNLFGKKRDESRAALAEALAQADKQGPRPAAENPVDPLSQSQVSSLSEVGLNALQAESTFTSVGAPGEAQRKRMILLAALAAGALLIAGGVAFALKSSSSGSALPKPASSAQVDVVKPPVPAQPSAPAVDLGTLPIESATAEIAPPSAPRTTAAAPKLQPLPLPAASSTALKPKPPAPKWRQDPGF
jgi:hypothetical protein